MVEQRANALGLGRTLRVLTMQILANTRASAHDSRRPKTEYGEALSSEHSDQAEDWTQHKAASAAIQSALGGTLASRYAQELSGCSLTLALELLHDGAGRLRPWSRCKRRWCPVCSWRLSLQRWGQLSERLPALLQQQQGKVSWLMLTLTVRNCRTDDLRSEVGRLLKGFTNLRRRQAWPATAWLRALEITFPREGEAHPHIHVLLAVKPSYFKKTYLSHATWQSMWRESAGLDYDPIVDVRRVKPLRERPVGMPESAAEALGGAAEVSKYVVKPEDLSAKKDVGVVISAMAALKGRRLVDAGGWLRGIFSEHDDDAQQDELPEVETVAAFTWRAAESLYRRNLRTD